MNNLETTKMQTPIEIALGVDEDGMTTARKLYAFLELAQGQFSRWAKSNIVDNEFATENEDYWGFDINVEGNKTQDYKLTAHFAKKLSMKGNGAKAEEARDYFTTLEERVKQKVIDLNQLSPELQMFQKIFNSVAEQQLEQKRQAEQLNHVEQRVESIREVVALDTTSWRDDTGNILRKISMELGGGQAYSQVRAESYELLSKRMGVNLKQRLTNKRRRMADEGICKSTRDKLSYVDIIAEDKKLIEGYTAIVKEMAIRYGVGKDQQEVFMDRQNIALRKTLDQIGVKHSLKGYGYIISAVEKCLENRSKLINVIKGFYTEIAEENGDTVWRVERSIRHAIEVTWTNGNTNAINKIFGYTVSVEKGKPTNSEFIALITDFVSLYGDEIANGSYKW